MAAALLALSHDWSGVHSEQRCSIGVTALLSGRTGSRLPAAAATSQMAFTHHRANVSGLGRGRGRGGLRAKPVSLLFPRMKTHK